MTATINLLDGKPVRVTLLATSDPYSRLQPGTEGTAQFIDSAGTLHVNWDDGSSLGLIFGQDRFMVDGDPSIVERMRERTRDFDLDGGYSFS